MIIDRLNYLHADFFFKYNLQNKTLQGKSNHKLVYQSTNLDIKNAPLRHREARPRSAVAIHPHLDCRVAPLLAMTDAKNEGAGVKEKNGSSEK